MDNIDFVITWVDGSDQNWLKKRNNFKGEYSEDFKNKYSNGDNRYRDYGTLRYLMRSIEKYASWVHKIFVIIDDQVPSWLKHNSKVSIVDHRDFIDKEYLPTFNSNAIELNIFKIKGLSENFVLFNDDFLLVNKVKPSDFFRDGLPVDAAIFSPIFPESEFDRIRINNMIPINAHFDKKKVQNQNLSKVFNFKYGKKNLNNILMYPYSRFSGFYDFHLPTAYSKSEFKKVWDEEYELIEQIISHKFREDSDISHWLVRYWRLMEGKFSVQKLPFGKYFYLFQSDKWRKEILYGKSKAICVNDAENIDDIGCYQEKLQKVLNEKFPDKSIFER